MAAFMFHLELMPMTANIVKVIPAHRDHINKLFAEGRILSYSVSAQREHIWCVVNAEEETVAMEIAAGFPLSPYFSDVTCVPLMFHNTLPAAMPGISLN